MATRLLALLRLLLRTRPAMPSVAVTMGMPETSGGGYSGIYRNLY